MYHQAIPEESRPRARRTYRSILRAPLYVAGYRYEALVYKNQTFIYFATTGMGLEAVTLAEVTAWMGGFDDITHAHKLNKRMTLALTDTTPTVTVSNLNITVEPDLTAEYVLSGHPDVRLCPTVTTDGCGSIDRHTMTEIAHKLRAAGEYKSLNVPSAVQIRLAAPQGIFKVQTHANTHTHTHKHTHTHTHTHTR